MFLNPLRQKIAEGKAVIGPLFQEVPDSPDLTEFLGCAGFDYVMVDGEHAGVDVKNARELARAAESVGICALARVPDADPTRILALLDSGIRGIILAHCNTAEDAEALVRACKYPPRGIRGASSGSRAARYGYYATAGEKADIFDRETMCLGLIEEPRAVPEIKKMLAVDGFDGCFLGAGDMALTLNRAYYGMAPSHPEVQKLIDQVRDETLAAGKLVMAPAGTGAAAKAMIDSGIQMIVVQFGQFLRAACNGYLAAARGE
jgi:2-dehydro-3-deoxyglucarate aldolase/4-hydroxy-2-oxoheptanedioate aldolase